jgi:putative transposase
MDNGPKFTGQMFMVWARRCGMTLHFTDPGKPVQNAYIKSFESFRTDT